MMIILFIFFFNDLEFEKYFNIEFPKKPVPPTINNVLNF